ncbi:MAG: hypothetical protein Q9159_002575 [Coniocarpon cinnabarinum]
MSSESTFSFQYVYKDEIPVAGMGACLIAGAKLKAMGYSTPSPPQTLSEDQLEFYEDPSTRLNQILSIVYFYRRIFVTHSKSGIDVLLKIAIATIVLWTITFELLIIFDCRGHISSNWASSGEEAANCPVGFTSEYGLAISDLILDVFIFLIPLPLTLRLQLSIKCKFAVCGIFLLGASAVGASVAQLILYVQVLKAATTNTVVDPNLANTVGFYWSLLEAGLSLIASCLPPIAYLFTHRSEYNILTSLRGALTSSSSWSLRRTQKSDAQSQSENLRGRASMKSGSEITRTTCVDVEHYDLNDLERDVTPMPSGVSHAQ